MCANFYRLNEEKQKGEKSLKKIKFIQDNQDIFFRLKQAYLNMKYNESVGRPMVEIREKAAERNRIKQFEELCQFTSPIGGDLQPVIAVKK